MTTFLRCYRVEFRRLLRSPFSWFIFAAALAAPMGNFIFIMGDTMSSIYLAKPVASGAVLGTLLFAVLTLFELDRIHRSGVCLLTDSVVSPLTLNTAKLLAICTAALGISVLMALAYFPYIYSKLNIVFSVSTYLGSFFLLLLPALWMGAIAAALFYQLVGRVDVSFLAVLSFLLVSRGSWFKSNNFMQWSLPALPALTDNFSNAPVFRSALYTRIIWLGILGGGWLLSLLCVRRYGKGMAGSFAANAKRLIPAPAAALAMITTGVLLWRFQPLLDHTPIKWMEVESADRYVEGVYPLKIELDVDITSYLWGTLSGSANYQIKNNTGQPQEIYFNLNSGYRIQSMQADGQDIPWTDLKNDYINSREIKCTIPATETSSLEIQYSGAPKTWNVMQDTFSGSVISRKYIDLSSATLAPCFSDYAAEELPKVSLNITLPAKLTPVTTGETPQLLGENPNGSKDWLLQNEGDRIMLYAADYVQRPLEGGEMPIWFYYSRNYEKQMEDLGAIDIMESAIRYCTEHYGPRSFTADRPFKILQDSVFTFGGAAWSTLSVMGESYFSSENLSDPEKGPSSAEVLAHEITHQWWGLGASMMDYSQPYWTDEGITTYTSYRLIKELKGEAYAQKNYVEKWQAAVDDANNSFYVRHPEYMDILPDEYAASIASAIKGVNHYDGTALMIKQIADKIGEDKLDAALSELYQNGGTEFPPYISFTDFLNACGVSKEEFNYD